MQAMRVSSAAVMVAVAVLAGCATVTTPTKGDPFESYNRTMFTINDKIDEVALKIGQFRPEQHPITVDVVAMGTDTGQVLFEHCRPS